MLNEYLNKEDEVVKLLAKYYLSEDEKKILIDSFQSNLEMNKIMGSLILHRVIGPAWMSIRDHVIPSTTTHKNEEFFFYLNNFYTSQLNRAEEHLYQTKQVIDVFNKENIDYVIIKGISLGLDLYENIGMRWFNDVDILLKHDDIKKALSLLKSIGYVQGEYNFIKSSIELANRKDIISSPLLSHEVFPLVKHLPNSNINFHEVDLQFSLDLLTNNRTDELVNDFLIRKITLKEHEEIKTLSPEDHLLFLCIHFYKEAIYLEEVMNHKDFVLYKILDIYRLLLKYEKTLNWNRILLVAEEHNLNRVLLFALTYTLDMYGKSRKSLIPNNVKSALSLEDKDNRELLNLVFDKNGKDKYCWYVPNNQKFFSIKRFEILENIR